MFLSGTTGGCPWCKPGCATLRTGKDCRDRRIAMQPKAGNRCGVCCDAASGPLPWPSGCRCEAVLAELARAKKNEEATCRRLLASQSFHRSEMREVVLF